MQPPIEKTYSSPYYRCLQTIEPYISRRQQLQGDELPAESNSDSPPEGSKDDAGKSRYQILCESGLSEWYGSAPFEHPTSAPPETLRTMFPALLDPDYQPTLVPTRTGESIDELHDRVAATMEHIIAQCDRDGTRSVLLCTHAAVVIALGRVLTGVMPVEIDVQDFGAFTCGLSVYKRRERSSAAVEAAPAHRGGGGVRTADPASGGTEIGVDSQVELRDNRLFRPEDLIKTRSRPKSPVWRGGLGVSGGWDCTLDSDCSFLSGGEERGWYVLAPNHPPNLAVLQARFALSSLALYPLQFPTPKMRYLEIVSTRAFHSRIIFLFDDDVLTRRAAPVLLIHTPPRRGVPPELTVL